MPVAFTVPSFTVEIIIKDFALPSSLPSTLPCLYPLLASPCHLPCSEGGEVHGREGLALSVINNKLKSIVNIPSAKKLLFGFN